MKNDAPHKPSPVTEMEEPRWSIASPRVANDRDRDLDQALLFLFAGQSYCRSCKTNVWPDYAAGWRFGIAGTRVNYQKIAQFGYSATGEMRPLLVFYPLYPWTVRLLAIFTRDYMLSAFIISTLASLGSRNRTAAFG